MSLSTRTLVLATVAAVAAGSLGYAVVTRDGDRSDRSATVVAAPVDDVEAVRVDGPAHAALTVSNRFFQRSRVAVLTSDDESARTEAIATAKRLRVPVLLDDPAIPAELARLRSRTVLTFGDVEDVVGAVPITGSSDAERNQQVTRAVGDDVAAPADELEALVLLQDGADHPVAAATAGAAGARVVEIGDEDLRSDASVAELVAAAPDASVLALGEDVDSDVAYEISVIRADATQIEGGYLAMAGRVYVGLSLQRRDATEALALLDRVRESHADNAGRPAVPLIELDTVDPDEAEAAAVAAAEAGAYTVVGLPQKNATQVAEQLSDVMTRPHVGASIPGGSAERVDDVAAWLADRTAAETLPQKILLVDVDPDDLAWIDRLAPAPSSVVIVLRMTTTGRPDVKLSQWRTFSAAVPDGMWRAWTNDERADEPMLSIAQTWATVRPRPAIVSYR